MRVNFPKSFAFGIGDSDLQVIGEDNTKKYEDSPQTTWDYFARNSGKCFQNQTPGEGIDRYHLWKEDIEIMKELGIHSYRTSVSMARTLKTNGDVNLKAVEWYRNYFREIRKNKIKIFATLYHWELPQYLLEQGGWTNKKTIDLYLKHVKIVIQELGEFIEEYFLLNEPRCTSLVAYYVGAHAPGEQNLEKALLVAHNNLLAQGLAQKEIHAIDKNIKLSSAINAGARYPETLSEKDVEAAKIADGHKNLWFLDPIFLGKYPDFMVKLYGNKMPKVSKDEMEILKIGDKMHSLGVNYYRGDIVKQDPTNELGFKTLLRKDGQISDLGWGIYVPPHYSEGLYDILSQIYFSYKTHGLKRIYITENGIALKTQADTKRIEFMQNHLYQIYKAMERGIPIEAYFHWTLMDNYEWAEGYRPESSFGLVHVNRNSMKRKPKKSFNWYKEIIKTGSLSI